MWAYKRLKNNKRNFGFEYMKFNEASYQSYLKSTQQRAKEADTLTGWLYDSDGCFVSPRGYGFCVTIDAENEVFKVWASKNKNFDLVANQDGSSCLSERSAKTSYLIHVGRTYENNSLDAEEISEVFRDFDAKLGKRSGHYRYAGVHFQQDAGLQKSVNNVVVGESAQVLFNIKGYNVFERDLERNALRRVQSIYRLDDHFKPVHLNNNILKNGFSSVSVDYKVSSSSLSDSFFQLDSERRCISQDTWEQRSLYKGFRRDAIAMAQAFNYLHGTKPEKALASVAVGSAFFMASPQVGVFAFSASVLYAAFHEELHKGAERSVDALKIFARRSLQKALPGMVRKNWKDPKFGEIFLKGGENIMFDRSNVYKFAPKANDYACKVERNTILPEKYFGALGMYLHAKRVDDVHHDSVEEFLAKIHQLNLPGKIYRLDRHVDGFEYDNGVSGVRYDNPDTRDITVIAKLNAGLVNNPDLMLPSEYTEQLGDGFLMFDARVIDGVFEVVSHERGDRIDALSCISNILFAHQENMPEFVRERSHQVVRGLFPYEGCSPFEDYCVSDKFDPDYLVAGVCLYPYAEAVLSDQELCDRGLVECLSGCDVSIS